MAEPQTNATPQTPRAAVGMFDVFLEGKVDDIYRPRDSEYIYFAIQTKAENEFSYPGIVQVSQPASERDFANVGDMVRIKCRVSGYSRKKDGNRFITNTLNLVERV